MVSTKHIIAAHTLERFITTIKANQIQTATIPFPKIYNNTKIV